ncbi:ArpU family transcriptional regulator [Bacillus sp. RG28]|uniref:ArpU family transcriptional regulator n=1 Tax=Gottfriedia endophytica TaxID=2820819 RepID=A0A940NNS1_9BACI|nr:ArpU family phage packaging/lysis transcriptional regulator [Gottfriedia endophytica]MBP0725549.1 ArpU family transcriptional regulator [Gottfriedia endophytica]
MNQLQFTLPTIDKEKTKEAVEAFLERYRVIVLTEDLFMLPKTTATYTLVPPSNTNTIHSSTEAVAINNIDLENKRKNFMKRAFSAVNRLSMPERAIIIKRYLNQDDVFDYEVYNELNLSERKYYRVKARAFYKLALILKIEVYEESKEVSNL